MDLEDKDTLDEGSIDRPQRWESERERPMDWVIKHTKNERRSGLGRDLTCGSGMDC